MTYIHDAGSPCNPGLWAGFAVAIAQASREIGEATTAPEAVAVPRDLRTLIDCGYSPELSAAICDNPVALAHFKRDRTALDSRRARR